MKIKLVAYGIAKDILRSRHTEIEMKEGDTINTLKRKLFHMYPDFSDLNSIQFAVLDNYQSDDFILGENHEVIIIPPVSGG